MKNKKPVQEIWIVAINEGCGLLLARTHDPDIIGYVYGRSRQLRKDHEDANGRWSDPPKFLDVMIPTGPPLNEISIHNHLRLAEVFGVMQNKDRGDQFILFERCGDPEFVHEVFDKIRAAG